MMFWTFSMSATRPRFEPFYTTRFVNSVPPIDEKLSDWFGMTMGF